MSILVVGGTAKGVGKTALLCGILAAMPEQEWIAVKITPHAYHGGSITQQVEDDPLTDTGRFLLAGAKKALLIEAPEAEQWPAFGQKIRTQGGNLIVESNRIAAHLAADLYLGVLGNASSPEKSSFALIRARADAFVAQAGKNVPEALLPPAARLFHLAQFNEISDEMREWLRARLSPSRL